MAALAIGDGKYTHLPDFDFELSAAGLHVQFAFFLIFFYQALLQLRHTNTNNFFSFIIHNGQREQAASVCTEVASWIFKIAQIIFFEKFI